MATGSYGGQAKLNTSPGLLVIRRIIWVLQDLVNTIIQLIIDGKPEVKVGLLSMLSLMTVPLWVNVLPSLGATLR